MVAVDGAPVGKKLAIDFGSLVGWFWGRAEENGTSARARRMDEDSVRRPMTGMALV